MIINDTKTANVEDEVLYDCKDGEYGEITEPFDPKQVDIITETMVISNVIERLKDNHIILDPDFQRRKDLWDDQKQSRLIESLIIRIPLPTFYFDYDDNTDNYTVVDGLQRLCAIKRFASLQKDDPGRLRLVGLEYLTELNGKTYEDLPAIFQRRIREQSIIAYVIRPGTPEPVRNSIFTRINTGGLHLTAAEIKNSIYRGQASDFVRELAHSEQFVRATNKKVDTSRMLDREFVNRFLAFYLLDVKEYRGNLESFFNDVLMKLKNAEPSVLNDCKKSFFSAMELVHAVFGKTAFKRIQKNNKYSNMINKPLFECVSVCFAKLSKEQQMWILERKEIFVFEYEKMLRNPEFITVITNGTAKKNSVEIRFNYMNQLINQVIG